MINEIPPHQLHPPAGEALRLLRGAIVKAEEDRYNHPRIAEAQFDKFILSMGELNSEERALNAEITKMNLRGGCNSVCEEVAFSIFMFFMSGLVASPFLVLWSEIGKTGTLFLWSIIPSFTTCVGAFAVASTARKIREKESLEKRIEEFKIEVDSKSWESYAGLKALAPRIRLILEEDTRELQASTHTFNAAHNAHQQALNYLALLEQKFQGPVDRVMR